MLFTHIFVSTFNVEPSTESSTLSAQLSKNRYLSKRPDHYVLRLWNYLGAVGSNNNLIV